MRKWIIVLAMVLCLMFTLAEVREAKAVVFPLPIALLHVWVGGSHVAFMSTAFGPLLGAAIGPPILFSPYLIMYYNNPGCRNQPSIGDMSNCIQKGASKAPVKKK